jgi:hypothetical protein
MAAATQRAAVGAFFFESAKNNPQANAHQQRFMEDCDYLVLWYCCIAVVALLFYLS